MTCGNRINICRDFPGSKKIAIEAQRHRGNIIAI